MGTEFQTGDVSELLFEWLLNFLSQHPETLAMLEFTSLGPNRRQVDCALVGPGGIDLIEVKNKRGVVRGSADGEWTVEDRTGTVPFTNTKAGRTENPYHQASNTATDLERGLRRFVGGQVRVMPLVLVPAPDPASAVEPQHSRVWLALSISELKGQLRSAPRISGGGWNRFDYHDLPGKLSLRAFNLAFVQGRIISAATHDGVADVTIQVGGPDNPVEVQTDIFGRYAFSGTLKQTLQLRLIVPGIYMQAELPEVSLSERFIEVADLKLQTRFSVEDLQAAYQEQERLLHQRFSQRMSKLSDQRLSEHAKLGLVLDELTAELHRAQRRIIDLEQDTKHQRTPVLTLPNQVLVPNSERLHSEQQLQIAQALHHLTTGTTEARKKAVKPATQLLAQLSLSLGLALSDSTPASQVRALTVTSRFPTVLPADVQDSSNATRSDVVDVDSFSVTGDLQDSKSTPAKRPRGPGHFWLAISVAGIALMGGAMLVWPRLRPVSSGELIPTQSRGLSAPVVVPSQEPQSDAVKAVPTSDPLPGVPASTSPPDETPSSDVGLPGIPVSP